MKPYYQDKWVTIYHGDCREILPQLDVKVDLVLTDPPYIGLQGGDQHWGYGGVGKNYRKYERVGDPWDANTDWVLPTWAKTLKGMIVFCSYHNVENIPILLSDAKRIALACWYQRNTPPAIRNVPHHSVQYIWYLYKEQGLNWGNLETHYDIPQLPTGCMASGERYLDKELGAIHPTQKPEALMMELLKVEPETVLDPFLGTGTTCFCAKKLNRYSIGIEIEEKYCEIAARRCSQEVMELKV